MTFPPSIQTALLTGYSVFTTFTVENNSVKGFSKHIDRLQNNSEVLFGIIPEKKTLIEKIKEFLQTLSCEKSLVRVALFPENFNISQPGNIKKIQIIVTGRKLQIPTKPITLELHEMIRPLAHLKTSTLFQSLQTRRIAQQNGFSDSLFFYNGFITEGPSWNIIFGKKNILYFPDPSKKTFLEGFTQTLLQENLPKEYQIKITDIKKEDIKNFEYCCIVSSGVGVIPISSIEEYQYDIKPVILLQEIYNNIASERIC